MQFINLFTLYYRESIQKYLEYQSMNKKNIISQNQKRSNCQENDKISSKLSPMIKIKSKESSTLANKQKDQTKQQQLSPILSARIRATYQNCIKFQASVVTPTQQYKSLQSKKAQLYSKLKQQFQVRKLNNHISFLLQNIDKTVKNERAHSNLLINKNQHSASSEKPKQYARKNLSEGSLSIAFQKSFITPRQIKSQNKAMNHVLRMTKIRQMYNMMDEQKRRKSKVIEPFNNFLVLLSRKMTTKHEQKIKQTEISTERKGKLNYLKKSIGAPSIVSLRISTRKTGSSWFPTKMSKSPDGIQKQQNKFRKEEEQFSRWPSEQVHTEQTFYETFITYERLHCYTDQN